MGAPPAGPEQEPQDHQVLPGGRQPARGLLVEEADHDGDPTTVTHADVEEFIAHLNATRSASTGRTRFAALQQLFKWLRVVEHEIDADPMADLDPPKVGEVEVRPFSFEERQAILDSVPKRSRDFLTRRDRAILYLLIDTGVRRSGAPTSPWPTSTTTAR